MKKIITTLPDPPWDDSVTHNLEIKYIMKPQEKAKELINKYRLMPDRVIFPPSICKQCALIAVEEIIEYSKEDDSIRDINGDPYWQKVKEEIQKL